MEKYVLDENGDPVPCPDLLTWGRWFDTADRVVARDELGVALVSTVFLGIDHAFDGGIPVLFETMVFGGEYDQECERYATRTAALEGHARWLAKARDAAEGTPSPPVT